MMIMSPEEKRNSSDQATLDVQEGDLINGPKFNALPAPVTAKMLGGSEWPIESLDVQTGCMRLDVCGKIDVNRFSEVVELIDIDGGRHDPDDFWLE